MLQRQVFIAVIGGVAGGQEDWLERLGPVNEQYGAVLSARFAASGGGRFQGLLSRPESLAALLSSLRVVVHPAEIRFGVGIGILDVPPDVARGGVDGPCLHRARSALESAERFESVIEVEAPVTPASFRVFGSLYSALRKQWTDRQRLVHDLSLSGKSGREIARRLGVAPSAVSQHLKAAETKAVAEATRAWEGAVARAFEMSS